MVKSCRRPGGCRVTIGTEMREGVCNMVRVGNTGEVTLMTAVTGRRRVSVTS